MMPDDEHGSDCEGCNPPRPNVSLALHEAVAAIYFNDSSDYETALWGVVKHLDPKIAELLEEDEKKAFDITAARVMEED